MNGNNSVPRDPDFVYRHSSIGQSLHAALEQMKQEQQIDINNYSLALYLFDRAMNQAFETVECTARIEGVKVAFREFKGVIDVTVRDLTVRDTDTHQTLDHTGTEQQVRILAVAGDVKKQ